MLPLHRCLGSHGSSRRRLHVGLLVAVCSAGAVGCHRRGPVAARVASAQGEVTLQAAEERSAARPGAALYDGDIVATADRSSAAVAFEGSGVVSLGANTALVIRRTGATATQLGAVLLRGSVHARAAAGGVRFTVGTPFGLAEIGGGKADAEVAVSSQEGIRVLLGDIEVVSADGTRTKLASGAAVSPSGVVIAAAAIAPVAFQLVANPAQVQVRRGQDEPWRAPAPRGAIAAGEAVRTRHAQGTELRAGESAHVSLAPDTELDVLPSVREGDTDRLRYSLAGGGIALELSRGGSPAAVHEVRVGRQVVVVEPGLTAADVEVRASGSGRALVTVRQGRATLPGGVIVEPGTTATLEQDGTSSVHPLAGTQIELHAGKTSVVSFEGGVPAVKLACDDVAGGPPYELEVATDGRFEKSVWHEKVGSAAVVTDGLRPGRWYWRVRSSGQWSRGTIDLQVARSAACRGCQHTNVIDDTGESTVVYFQKTLPSITLRWATVAGASRYRVEVFRQSQLDAPLVEERVTGTTLALPAGRLGEGKYFWLVHALAPSGKELSAGRTNELGIAYDNAVLDLDVRTPLHLARVDAGEVVTSGEVRVGGRLAINGKAVAVDGKGRFRETVALVKGLNQIVYRTVATGGVERFYVREVVRP